MGRNSFSFGAAPMRRRRWCGRCGVHGHVVVTRTGKGKNESDGSGDVSCSSFAEHFYLIT